MTRATINPTLFRWARERAGMETLELEGRFPKFPEWERGEAQPTLKQLEAFAKAVHVPIGYLFLAEPPQEPLPIPDFRTFAGRTVTRPSPNLLDMLYTCQERQSWYREYAQVTHQPPLEFIGSATLDTPPENVAEEMRAKLSFSVEVRRDCPTWEEALRLFIKQADSIGALIMVSGVALNNNRRTLNEQEFCGFALSDSLAPLIFINGASSKSAQMFTLAHELAHLWLGATALSNASAQPALGFRREEVWCNQVAAELLVPLAAIRAELNNDETLDNALNRLARHFKVSTLVILRRLLDARWLNRTEFDAAWENEISRLREMARSSSGGGDFYRTTVARVSRRFAQALVVSTLEGQTLFRDAFRMLGVSKTATFENLGREVGVLP